MDQSFKKEQKNILVLGSEYRHQFYELLIQEKKPAQPDWRNSYFQQKSYTWLYEYAQTSQEFLNMSEEISGIILVISEEEEEHNRFNINEKMKGLVKLKYQCDKLKIYLIDKKNNQIKLQKYKNLLLNAFNQSGFKTCQLIISIIKQSFIQWLEQLQLDNLQAVKSFWVHHQSITTINSSDISQPPEQNQMEAKEVKQEQPKNQTQAQIQADPSKISPNKQTSQNQSQAPEGRKCSFLFCR